MKQTVMSVRMLTVGASLILAHSAPQMALTPVSLPQVCLSAQEHHARELLGAPSLSFPVNENAMAYYVFELIQGGLKGRWKSQAHRIASAVIEESNRWGLDPLFVVAVMAHESNFAPDTRGRFGELGLLQIKPSTARWVQEKTKVAFSDLRDPVDNVRIGTAYLAYLRARFHRRSQIYISAYNLGPLRTHEMIQAVRSGSRYSEAVMRKYMDTRMGWGQRELEARLGR